MSSDPDHIRLLESVALHLLGTPNEKQSNNDRTKLRFGTNGSISVDLTKGVWHDFENNEGGGATDLIMREMGLKDAREAYEWAEREGFWINGKAKNGSAGKASLGKIVATYDYTDENGVLLFQVTRHEPKDFRQRRRAKAGDNPKDIKDGWVWKVQGIRRVPYDLPRVIEANGKQTIYICEGEKDCDNLIRLGLTATTNPGGASKGHGKWHDELTPHFRGADVVIIADNDDAGKTHAADVAAKLTGAAKRIRLLDIAAIWPECKPKCDISDWLDAGHSTEELGKVVARLPDQSISTRLGVIDAGDDVEKPDPRAWLLGNIFAFNFLSSLFGDGGVGKTALRYAQYMSLATDRSLTGEHVFRRCRVLIVSLEDNMEELRRRIWALRIHYDISEADLKGWLYLWAPGAKGGKLMELDKNGNPKVGDLRDNIEAIIVEKKIDLAGIDPFVKSHGVGENNNNAIDLVAQVLVDLMHKHNIAVDIPHHVSKPGAKGETEPGDANRGRGASALKDAARLVYTLNVMSKDDAELFGINETQRWGYVRMDKGKVNIAPPSRKAVWFHLIGVSLDNGNVMYPNGDEVQVIEPWFPADMWQDMSEEQIDAIIEDIDAGLPEGVRYSNHPQAKTRAAWKVVVKHAPTKTESQAREIIKAWVSNKRLIVKLYSNGVTRKEEEGLFENKERIKGKDEVPF